MKEIKRTKRGKLSLSLDREEFAQLIEVFQLMDIDKPGNAFKSDSAFSMAISFRLVRDFYFRSLNGFLHAGEKNTLTISEAEGMAIFKIFNNNTQVHASFPAVSQILFSLHQKLV